MVPLKATAPPSNTGSHCSVSCLNPCEDSVEAQHARLKQAAERRWHTVTDSPDARIDDFRKK